MKTKGFKILAAVLLILWCGLIFSLSAEPADKSSDTSGTLTRMVFSVVYPDFNDLEAEQQQELINEASFIIRKAAHFSLYLILGFLAFLNVAAYNGLAFWLKPFLSTLFCFGFSVSDEIHQRFVPGRSGEIRDVLIDVCGSVFAIAILTLILGLKNNGGGKMRKKELMKLNEQLFDRAENAMRNAEELKKENSSLVSRIEELEKKIAELEKKEVPSVPLKTLGEKLVNQVKLNEDTEYGASIIGKIVVSATTYCNELTASMETSAAKELVNLILGRTEVAKAEILKITSSNASIEDKKAMIDSELYSAEDYFKSVMAQK